MNLANIGLIGAGVGTVAGGATSGLREGDDSWGTTAHLLYQGANAGAAVGLAGGVLGNKKNRKDFMSMNKHGKMAGGLMVGSAIGQFAGASMSSDSFMGQLGGTVAGAAIGGAIGAISARGLKVAKMT